MKRSLVLIAVLVLVLIGAFVALGDRGAVPVADAPAPPQAGVAGEGGSAPASVTPAR